MAVWRGAAHGGGLVSTAVRTAWRLCIKLSDRRFMLGQAHASLG